MALSDPRAELWIDLIQEVLSSRTEEEAPYGRSPLIAPWAVLEASGWEKSQLLRMSRRTSEWEWTDGRWSIHWDL